MDKSQVQGYLEKIFLTPAWVTAPSYTEVFNNHIVAGFHVEGLDSIHMTSVYVKGINWDIKEGTWVYLVTTTNTDKPIIMYCKEGSLTYTTGGLKILKIQVCAAMIKILTGLIILEKSKNENFSSNSQKITVTHDTNHYSNLPKKIGDALIYQGTRTLILGVRMMRGNLQYFIQDKAGTCLWVEIESLSL